MFSFLGKGYGLLTQEQIEEIVRKFPMLEVIEKKKNIKIFEKTKNGN